MTGNSFASTMMHSPMTTQMIFNHGARIHKRSNVVSYNGNEIQKASFPAVAERAHQLANVLSDLGVAAGDRVATLCWNHQAHMEAYLAIPSMGAVLHTLNLRLFPDQLAYIINHAEDKVLIVDADLLHLLQPVWDQLTSVEHVLVVGSDQGNGHAIPVSSQGYDVAVNKASPDFTWPEIEEESGAVICYTSGTTGNPKGIVYSHKTIFVHSLASMGRDTFAIGQDDRVLLLPPMFHANAWGLPYTAWFAGSDLIMPASHLKPANTRFLIDALRPTFTAMVPTLINDLLASHRHEPLDMSSFRVIVSGGSPVAPALIKRVRETWNVPILQGWGMTETSPLCALSLPPRGSSQDEESHWRSSAGRPVPGMTVRLRSEDGSPAAEDGVAVGELQLRGPWVTKGYFKQSATASFTEDGWLRTGDIGTIDELGYVRITDRLKDVIKSGGEWISSVELEALLLEENDIAEAAIVAIPDERWSERPLAVVALTDATQKLDVPAIRARLSNAVAKFWVPEYWAIVESIPKTSVGKLDKKVLRTQVSDGSLEVFEETQFSS